MHKEIALDSIRENPIALRTVDRQSEAYLGLVDSIKNQGFIGTISVREKVDAETEVSYYELIDGLHRYNAAKDAGLTAIDVQVVDLDTDQALEHQIMMNIHKVETKPVEYSQQLKQILTRNPMMTESVLASKLGKSPQWVKERLGLNKITDEKIQSLINEGEITLSNAYALARLPEDEQGNFIDTAMTQPPDEFVPAVQKRIKEIKDAKRKGKDAAPQVFEPVAHMQKMGAVKDELKSGDVGLALLSATDVNDLEGAFKLGIQWCLHLDPQSVEVQKAKYDERAAKKEENKKKKAAERAAKKLEAAQKEQTEAAKAAAEVADGDPVETEIDETISA